MEFTRALDADKRKNYQKNRASRQRRPGGVRLGVLSTPELKLFFILFYLKNYPTFDIIGGIFDISASKAKQNVTKLLPILRQAEKNLGVLPHRHCNRSRPPEPELADPFG
ncbi:MAG: transposase family protein, partial [Lamprobacter sp.]|uniref:helix-turn-helix domain-containing protein n=1 Tax=Lamprobacter sp. TaxID=3100796 RepID=UPI002B2619B2